MTLKTDGADAEIQTLITRAFDVKNGKVDAKQILSLKAYPITHELWKEAMSMIDDAIEIVGTKSYIRFKHRKNGEVDGNDNDAKEDIQTLNLNCKRLTSRRLELLLSSLYYDNEVLPADLLKKYREEVVKRDDNNNHHEFYFVLADAIGQLL